MPESPHGRLSPSPAVAYTALAPFGSASAPWSAISGEVFPVSCQTCQGGLPPTLKSCPDCHAPNPHYDPLGSTLAPSGAEGHTFNVPHARPGPPTSAADRPIGYVVVYAEAAEASGGPVPTTFGRVHPLKAGQVFLAGKVLKDSPRADGAVVKPTAWHLFPFSEDYAHISRQHLTVEFETNGQVRLTDTSANGTWLVRAGLHLRRGRDASRVHTLAADESVVLGVDLGSAADPRAREKAARYTLQLIRGARGGLA